MSCLKPALLAVGIFVTLAAGAQAQAPSVPSGPAPTNWWSRMWLDYHRNQAWPDPFIGVDREAVNAPFRLMANNGWQRQNLVADYHFQDGDRELNQGGENRVYWIASQAPVNRRTVFVQRGPTQKITAERVRAVQQALAKMSVPGPPTQIMESNMDSRGYSGEEVDGVLTGASKTRPDPRIPAGNPTAISN